MKCSKSLYCSLALVLVALMLAGCAMTPGGVAPSTTPIEGRSYTNLGRTVAKDSRIYLFGILPVSGGNYIRDAFDEAVQAKGGDAMINVTVESFSQFWISS